MTMTDTDDALTGQDNGSHLVNGMRLGPYEITGFVGAGAMGEVYRANDTNLHRVVALKLLPMELASDPERLRRFEEESAACVSADHPAVVTIYDTGRRLRPLIAWSWLGETLRDLLAAGFSTSRALLLATRWPKGWRRRTRPGSLHRDLKPENIVCRRTAGQDSGLRPGQADLDDVGDEGNEPATRPGDAGVVVGTVGYMSPEQASGRPRLPPRISSRSARCSTRCRRGSGRFRPTTRDAVRDHTGRAAAAGPANPAVPPPVRWIVERCLAKDPQERYALTHDLARDLFSAREHLPELLASKRSRQAKRGIGHASIAVLPLVNLSADPQQEPVADAMTDALITQLTEVKALQVVSRASCMAYKGQKKLLPEIAEELGVDWILLGAIARAGGVVPITAQLVNAESDENRWASSYSRRPWNILSMQADVVATIAGAVRTVLLPDRAVDGLKAAS